MIQLPKRSVTRFFIPLIDVLTLLFCIFLLLPMVKGTGESPGDETAGAEDRTGPLSAQERRELVELRKKMAERDGLKNVTEQEREELEKIRREKIEELQKRLAIHVLEIDADTGNLFYYAPERTQITSEADAHALIQRQKQETVGRELYYLFLFPRKLTGFPEERQVKQYERWFEGVPHGIDNPRAAR